VRVMGVRANAGGTLAVTALAAFMSALDNLVVTFALPSIRQHLGATVQQLEWTVNAYTLTYAVFLMTGAALGDRFGRKRVFLIGVFIFTVASAGAALSTTVDALLAFRALQGFGGAILTPLSLTILSDAFPAEKRGIAIGAWSAVTGVAIAIGPLVGGAIVTGIAWQWIFWVNVPIGLVAIPLGMRWLRESYGPHGELDLPGLALASLGLLAVVFGVIRGSDIGWGRGQVVACLAAGVVILALFALWEQRAKAPMLPLRLLHSRSFTAINLVSFLLYFGLFGSLFLLAQFLQVARGYSAVGAGLRTLPWTAIPMVVAPIAGIVAERIGGRLVVAAGLAFQAVSLAWLAMILTSHISYPSMVPPMIVGGIGMGLVFPPISLVALQSVKPEEEGLASGANAALRELGGVFGIAVLASVFLAYGSYGSPTEFTTGLKAAMWVGVATLLLGVAIALLIPRRPAAQPTVVQPA
jgi:EmrB/QacA subfamily drug resistance transporter